MKIMGCGIMDELERMLTSELSELRDRTDVLYQILSTQSKNIDLITNLYDDTHFFIAREKFLQSAYFHNAAFLSVMCRELKPEIFEEAKKIYAHRVMSRTPIDKLYRFARILYYCLINNPAKEGNFDNALDEIEAATGQVLFIDPKSLNDKIQQHKLVSNMICPPSQLHHYNNTYSVADLNRVSRLVRERLELIHKLYKISDINRSEIIKSINDLNSEISNIQKGYRQKRDQAFEEVL